MEGESLTSTLSWACVSASPEGKGPPHDEDEPGQERGAQSGFPEEKQTFTQQTNICERLIHTRLGGRNDSQGVIPQGPGKRLLDPGESEAGYGQWTYSRSFCEPVGSRVWGLYSSHVSGPGGC